MSRNSTRRGRLWISDLTEWPNQNINFDYDRHDPRDDVGRTVPLPRSASLELEKLNSSLDQFKFVHKWHAILASRRRAKSKRDADPLTEIIAGSYFVCCRYMMSEETHVFPHCAIVEHHH